ncbi:hypothetical protein LPJ61_000123 [Coemansia biformis]|uniref:Uncharacterized protein n=1 Tax=Coemansia biformis TaxID=1286918 RepID=A0A9W7YC88_9FUNG|nr:hypothetical protein LPJ61_000123 [Coemansia biformis]
MYPPQQPAYPPELVEQVRQQRIRSVKRRGVIYGGLEVLFTVVFAALLVVYIKRANDDRNSDYRENWFRWYIGLLIGLLVLNVLFAAYTIWQTLRTLSILRNPNTPPMVIMAGAVQDQNYGPGRVVVIQQPPQQGYAPQQGYGQPYYQQPPPHHQQPPMYVPGGGQQSFYDQPGKT